MANTTIQLKRSSVAGKQPNTTTLSIGELAINLTDKKLYSSDGTNIFEPAANISNQRITNSLTLDNDKNIYFKTVNTSASVGFRQQSDDNFVMYSTNTTYGQRAVWSIYANSDTSAFSLSVPTIFNANVNLGQVALIANNNTGTAGQVLTTNGTSTYWSTVSGGGGSVNTSAQYTWTNTHTFQANINFTGNNITVVSNTGSVMFGGAGDTNWRIGRSTGSTTKFFYSNNTLDILAAASNLEGVVIGQPGGNTYLETGYAGTFTKNPIYVGNSTVNVSINSTSFTGTANNSLYLGGAAAASYVNTSQLSSNLSAYQTTSGLSANVATLAANSATYLNGKTEGNLNVNNALTSNNATNLGGTAASGYQTTAGLSANVATLTANNTSFVGSVSATNVVSNAQLSANLANYASLGGATFTGAVVVSNNLTVTGNLTLSGNTLIVGANNLVVSDAVISLHTPANLTPLTSNDGKNIGLAFHYYDTEDRHALLYRDNTTGYLQYHTDGSDPISNNNPTGNSFGTIQAASFWAGNSSVYATVNATTYTGTSNNTLFVGSITAANVVSNAQLSANLANYQTTAGLSANVATLAANNASFLGGTAAASFVQNTDSRTLSGNLNFTAANNTFSGNLTISSTGELIIASGAGIYANGSLGTSGQVLTTNGTTIYWANSSSGSGSASNIKNIVNTSVSTTQSVVDTVSATGTSTVEYLISARDNINSNYKSARVLITTNGTTSYVTEYGIVLSNNSAQVCSFDSDINTGNIRLLATGDSADVDVSLQRVVLGSSTEAGDIASSVSSGGGGFTNGQSISVNNFVITGAFSANSSNGTSGQVLTSNGTGTYWSTVSSSGNTGTTVVGSTQHSGSNSGIFIPATSQLEFGAGDFTIEFWWYPISTGRQSLYHGSVGTDWSLGIDYNSIGTNKIGIWASSTGTSWNIINADGGGNGTGTTTVPQKQWNHIAFVRNGSTWRLYLNGVQEVSVTSSATLISRSASDKVIGSWYTGTSVTPASGFISNFRAVKGVAVYTSAFTVPSLPLSVIANTVLLTAESVPPRDRSTNNLAVTGNNLTFATYSTSNVNIGITTGKAIAMALVFGG